VRPKPHSPPWKPRLPFAHVGEVVPFLLFGFFYRLLPFRCEDPIRLEHPFHKTQEMFNRFPHRSPRFPPLSLDVFPLYGHTDGLLGIQSSALGTLGEPTLCSPPLQFSPPESPVLTFPFPGPPPPSIIESSPFSNTLGPD